jgi:hypothetical protein
MRPSGWSRRCSPRRGWPTRWWNQAQLFWQDADEPLGDQDEPVPDPAEKATSKDVPHPLFVYVEGHRPEFLRDLGA